MQSEVGIGTTTPFANLHLVGYAVFSATATTFSGTTSAAYIRGNDIFSTATNPDYTWYNGDQTGLFHPSVGVIGFSVNGFGEVMRIKNNRLGIGTTNPLGVFELSLDQGRKPGTNTWTVVSDERLKNIEGSYNKGLKELLQLNPIVYHYKNVGSRIFKDQVLNTQQIGFSAQEVQKIFPEAVGTDEDGYLNLNIHAILISYLNAIKEQQVQIADLQKELAELKEMKTEYNLMKAEVDAIKVLLTNSTHKFEK
jgi:hypothetical protein